MTLETLDRIEALINPHVILVLKEVINNISDNMLEDGFEYEDVKKYIQVHLDEILGE
jgi:hypothetical protein